MEDAHLYRGRVGEQFATTFPYESPMEIMKRGRARYDIFCSPCHGRVGRGDGMIVRRGYRKPSSFHEDRLREQPAGYFYDVITNGFGTMPDYAAQIAVKDRWAIVAYVKALQLSQNATTADVPAPHRRELETP